MPQVTKTCTYTFNKEEVQNLLLEAIKKECRDKGIIPTNAQFSFNLSNYGEEFSSVEITVREAEHSGMYDR